MITTPDHSDALASPPAFDPVGPHPQGFYNDCDPATGATGTIYRAEEFNELILNLRQLLSDASVTAPQKGLATNLATALRRLFAGGGRTLVASTTLTPDDAGLVLVDAASADVTLTLPAAAALARGQSTVIFIRTDTSTHVVRIQAAAGDVIAGGILYLEDAQAAEFRSDGVGTWRLLGGLRTLYQSHTLNVAVSGGSANPVDPLGGNPFDTVPNALVYLRRWRLAAPLTIALPAGTWTHAAPIVVDHLDSQRITIQGVSGTIFQFIGCSGFDIIRGLAFTRVEIAGNLAGSQTNGLVIRAGANVTVDTVTVRHFTKTGVWVGYGVGGCSLSIANTLTVNNNTDAGLYVDPQGIVSGGEVVAIDNTGFAQVTFFASFATVARIATTRGTRGLWVTGSGAHVNVAALSIIDASTSSAAVLIETHAALKPTVGAVANSWDIRSGGGVGHTLRAESYGYVSAQTCLTAVSRAATSPAVNTLGNTQAYIAAT